MASDKYNEGMKLRRQVLGDVYVDRSLNAATEFSSAAQTMITEMCWGTTWVNDAISLKTRSLVTLGMLTAMRADQELKGHVRGALRNGCTVDEIQAVLLHATAYCGAPAGLEAFRAANETIQEWLKDEGTAADKG